MIIVLDWFPPILSPNDNGHWRKKAPFKKQYRADAFWITRQHKKPIIPAVGNIPVTVFFHEPLGGNHDLDNCLAAIKAGIDGIADALGVNDKRFRPYTIDFGCKVHQGAVAVCLTL